MCTSKGDKMEEQNDSDEYELMFTLFPSRTTIFWASLRRNDPILNLAIFLGPYQRSLGLEHIEIPIKFWKHSPICTDME